ncbi:hypothetical protein AX16_000746 [Volvariella volvacea WC 439]|nr:hypothetical protein AX16_000746 [Volvariella volvacea WC 439]
MSTRTYNAAEERKWNYLSQAMDNFHQHFKREFNALYDMADGSFNKRGLSLRTYLENANRLSYELTVHHTVEERHFFPKLAKRMPQFKTTKDTAHMKSHEGIHRGLDALSVLVQKYKENPSSYSPEEMRACLDSFRDILFRHLDEEVADLSAENLKKYWTLEEVERLH